MKAEKTIPTKNKGKHVKKLAITTSVKALSATLINLNKKSRKQALDSNNKVTFLKAQKKQH